MPWHHIIPKHEWKIRFGTLRGVNASDNLIFLSEEQHIEVHKMYYDERKLMGDLWAYRGMMGHSTKEEIRYEIAVKNGHMHKGMKRTHQMKEKMSKLMAGELNHRYGVKETLEVTEKRIAPRRGVAQKTLSCPHCGKVGGYAPMNRWHFEKCLRRI